MSRIHRNSFSVFIGLTGIATGALYMAKSFGYLNGIELSDYWPLLLMIFGIARIIHPRSTASYFWGPLSIAVGGLFLASNLHHLPFDPARFWPVLLIVFGMWIIVRPFFGFGRCKDPACSGAGSGTGKWHRGNWGAGSVINDNELDVALTMSGGKYICTGKEFKGGSIRLRAAGAEIDLTNVETNLEEIPLYVDCKLGGIEMRIPQSWTVNYLGRTIMGAMQDHTRPVVGSTKKLVIRGELALAGIEIRN